MGSTNVTGSGLGSAKVNKGSEHMSVGVEKLVGPHIVAAGTETLSGTTAVIEIPAPATAVTGYHVQLSNNSSTHAYVSTALAVSGVDSGVWTLTVTAGSGDIVKWSLVKEGV